MEKRKGREGKYYGGDFRAHLAHAAVCVVELPSRFSVILHHPGNPSGVYSDLGTFAHWAYWGTTVVIHPEQYRPHPSIRSGASTVDPVRPDIVLLPGRTAGISAV